MHFDALDQQNIRGIGSMNQRPRSVFCVYMTARLANEKTFFNICKGVFLYGTESNAALSVR